MQSDLQGRRGQVTYPQDNCYGRHMQIGNTLVID